MKAIKIVLALACLLGYAVGLQAQTCNASLPETTPSAAFTDHFDGTVTHTRTGLMWQRCAQGQNWSGSTCTGVASTFTWSAALLAGRNASAAGYSDWRLPNVKELESIVERKCYAPSINASVFPNTSASVFWSASAGASGSSYAWYVNFGDGYASYGNKYDYYQVRLVRAGQSFCAFDSYDTVPLSVSKTGAGSVSGGPIHCGSSCSGNVSRGFAVTLTATPAANLSAWGGACASAGTAPTCSVTMDVGKTVTATFLDTPIVSVMPGALSFASQNVGSSSAAQTLTLSNSGTTLMSSLVLAASGDFSLTQNLCLDSLAVNASCTFGVRFTPTQAGARSGSVSISSNAPGSPQSAVALTGTGQGGLLALSPSALYFSARYTGTSSSAQSVTLSNVGGTDVNFNSLVVNGEFSRSGGTCGTSLAPGVNCSVSVVFSPATVGAQVGSLVISSDGSGSPQTVGLSGTGLAAPGVALSPGSLTFDSQRQGTTSAAQTITLLNSGAATLGLYSISASGDFGVTHNCGTGPAAGASCTLSATFTPTALGTRSGSVSISSNAIGSPHSVGLSGVGISANTPLCLLSAAPTRIQPGRSSTLTAACTPATLTYTWSGGNCASSTGPSCTDTPALTTVYSVTGSNNAGSSAATATVTVQKVDLTPILMLLLE